MGLKRYSSFIVLVLLLSLGEDLGGASASFYMLNNARVSCNGAFADCFFGSRGNEEDWESLWHYSAGGRLLLQQGQAISYGALQRPAVCNAAQYANCIVPVNMNNRPCTAYNRCKRAG